MKIHQILKTDFREMPWKNGGGTTFEIDREPATENYDWRLSQARIGQSGPFSDFPGYSRLLAICAGDGIRFQEKVMRPGQVIQFDGVKGGDCELLGGEVLDLGLIYRPTVVTAQLVHVTQSTIWTETSDINYFCPVLGDWQWNGQNLIEGSCLKVANGRAPAKLVGQGSLFVISLRKRISKGQ